MKQTSSTTAAEWDGTRSEEARACSVIKTYQKASNPSNVFGQLAGPLRDVVVTTVRDPPWLPPEAWLDGFVQLHTVTDIHLLVQPAVNNHHRALRLFDPVDVRVNIQAC
jgi:hypothetical protein